MKAIVGERYGTPDVLELRDIDTPAVGAADVRIRVRAAGVNAADWHLLTGTPRIVRIYTGLRRPKRHVLGLDAAGTIDAVGAEVTRFAPGDEVFATSDDGGAFAEYMCVAEKHVVPTPAGVGVEDAAAVPVSALTALQGLRDKGRLEAGHHALINGASGGVGTFAVQVARTLGAEVTGVCSTRNMEMVRSIGADHVVDYTREDFTQASPRYDVILDLVGNRPVGECTRPLRPEGIYVAAAGPPSRALRIAITRGRRTVTYVSQPRADDLRLITEWLEAGSIRPVIDRRYTFGEVPDAIAYVGEGHTRGRVVVTM